MSRALLRRLAPSLQQETVHHIDDTLWCAIGPTMPTHRPTRLDPRARHDERTDVLEALRRIIRTLRVSAGEAERRTGVSTAQLFVLQQLAQAPAASLNE